MRQPNRCDKKRENHTLIDRSLFTGSIAPNDLKRMPKAIKNLIKMD